MKGILVNYEFCTGCHSCEVACKKYLDLPKSEFGIKISEIGPWQYQNAEKGPDKWEWTWVPTITKACNMCEDRVALGKMPMCVQHCQAWIMHYGEVEELTAKIKEGSRWVLLTK